MRRERPSAAGLAGVALCVASCSWFAPDHAAMKPSRSPTPALRGAGSVLTRTRLRPGARCPVTRPAPPPPLVAQAFAHDAGFADRLYGHDTLYVVIPIEPRVQRDPATGMFQEAKLVWYITGGPTPLRIVGRRLDGAGQLVADTSGGGIDVGHSGYIQPTSVEVSQLGCWDVAGTVNNVTTEFVWQPVLAPSP